MIETRTEATNPDLLQRILLSALAIAIWVGLDIVVFDRDPTEAYAMGAAFAWVGIAFAFAVFGRRRRRAHVS